ncbi:MAG: L,D-transpeptidase [Polyangiaceae bacterium]
MSSRRPSALLALALVPSLGCDPGRAEGMANAAEIPAEATATATAEQPPPKATTVASTQPAPEAVRWPARPTGLPKGGDHIYSKSRHLWVRPQPQDSGSWLGYLSLGDAVRVAGGDAEEAFAGMGSGRYCERWYAVEPVGFVCTGELATLDADDPTVVELRRRAAKRGAPFPYRYAESLHAPVYLEPPSEQAMRGKEFAFDDHLAAIEAARRDPEAERPKQLVGVDLSPAPPKAPALLELPPHGRPNQAIIHMGSTLAYVDRFQHAGRSFLLTWDGGIVPQDRTRPYPESDFHGVVLGVEGRLPLAFVRGADIAMWRLHEGRLVEDGKLARLAHVELTGVSREQDGTTYLETRQPDRWVAEGDVTVARAVEALPESVSRQGAEVTWVDVSIVGGTLVAYEGDRPVYATMISPGRGGLPQRGVPTLDTASTPTGTYSVLGKFVTATMQSSSVATLVHAEVQYTMNFSGPYALHGAYWHDRFGEKMSGGCVNLAPIDAERIFEWAEPRLPDGWHGMRTLPKSHDFGRPTMVHLHR